ncbi:MAG: hypothetical protein ACLQRH_09945 [Acidimicrobiales bacterium]
MHSGVALYRASLALAFIFGARRAWTVDDLLCGDALQGGAGRGQVRAPQLALDRRNPLAQQLDSMSMAELVGRRTPASSAIWCS